MESTEYYNCKVLDYGNGVRQYRFYEKPLFKGTRREQERDIPAYLDCNGIQVNTKTGEVRTQQQIDHSIDSSCKRSLEKVYQYAMCNRWDWFFTLTFNPGLVDSMNYDVVLAKVRKWFNNVHSRYAPDIGYLVVPEQHKSGRWHFHALVSDAGALEFVDSGHKSHGEVIYNIPQFRWGFTTATRVQDTKKVSSYLCKYITKDLCRSTQNKRRYLSSKNLRLPDIQEQFIPNHIKPLLLAEMADNIQYTKQVDLQYTDNRITYITVEE